MVWHEDAACRDKDPELFFPVGTTEPAIAQIRAAKAVCATCTVQDPCLHWSLRGGLDAGVWGGLDENERRSLKRRTARAQARENDRENDCENREIVGAGAGPDRRRARTDGLAS